MLGVYQESNSAKEEKNISVKPMKAILKPHPRWLTEPMPSPLPPRLRKKNRHAINEIMDNERLIHLRLNLRAPSTAATIRITPAREASRSMNQTVVSTLPSLMIEVKRGDMVDIT